MTNNKIYKYDAILVNGPFKGVYAEFPYDSRKEFGTGKAVAVSAKIDGFKHDMNLLPNGKGGHWLHLRKEIRDQIGKLEGDTVNFELIRDYSIKTVEVPDYLQWLLDDDPSTAELFSKQSYSTKKFWITHIQEPKGDNAKVERINRLFEFLVREASKNR